LILTLEINVSKFVQLKSHNYEKYQEHFTLISCRLFTTWRFELRH